MKYAWKRPAWEQGAENYVRYAFLAFYVYVGLKFFLYAMWGLGFSNVYIERPPSVEAFLPIGALMSLKRLLLAGAYDPVHPAGLTILLMAIASAFLLRKGFCGFLCPVGAVSRLLEKLGASLGLQRRPPRWLSIVLTIPKYLLLAFFFYIILWSMNIADIENFMRSPYYIVADSKMLLFFLRPTAFVLVCLAVLVLGGMIIPGFWCRGFCPYGAFLGLFSFFSPVAVNRNPDTCINCGRCSQACPSRIAVHEKNRVSDPECVGCVSCLRACPVKDCLSLRTGYTRQAKIIPAVTVAFGSALIVAALFLWAAGSGRWDNGIPPEMLRFMHDSINSFQHP